MRRGPNSFVFKYIDYIHIRMLSHPTVGVAPSAPKSPWAIEFLM